MAQEKSKLQLYINIVSQPSRAILIFCKLNNIEPDVHHLDIMKGEHKSPEFKAINPMGQVPAIVDNDFKLFESHAILKYLATTFPGVSENWYPSDPKQRARIDSILDWHHGNLRRGATGLVMAEMFVPLMKGVPKDQNAIMDAEKTLESALSDMEEIWLDKDDAFLGGLAKPSIADLALACEIMELPLLGAEKYSSLMDTKVKVLKWLSLVEVATAPHFAEVHALLSKAFQKE